MQVNSEHDQVIMQEGHLHNPALLSIIRHTTAREMTAGTPQVLGGRKGHFTLNYTTFRALDECCQVHISGNVINLSFRISQSYERSSNNAHRISGYSFLKS